MKALVVSIALLLVAGCASQPPSKDQPANKDQPVSTGGHVRYECYTYVGSIHVLTLPIPEADAGSPRVQITFHGDRIPAIYRREGLTQLWLLEEDLYIQVNPEFVASYFNFKGAEAEERRKPEAVLKCEKRK